MPRSITSHTSTSLLDLPNEAVGHFRRDANLRDKVLNMAMPFTIVEVLDRIGDF